jgi:uncharacterized membrane protein
MADENITVVLGVPVPSADKVFLAIVGVHVLFGLAALITGAVAMLSKKGCGRHSNLGTVYFWCLFGVFVTMSALSFMRWPENYDLFILGALSFASAPAALAPMAQATSNRHGRVLHLDAYRVLRG